MSIPELNSEIKGPSEYTKYKNKEQADDLGIDIDDAKVTELELAFDRCILPISDLELKNKYTGSKAFSVKEYSFFDQKEVPDTVNPSLWLNGKGNAKAGVFEVIPDKIYQVRGIDISNLTAVRSKRGWVIQDVMTTIESSSAALDLISKAIGEDVRSNIRAIIISHSHGDHFGGIKGVVDEKMVGPDPETQVQIYVPAGFDEECVKENIYAGTAMGRRAEYQFGHSLTRGPLGFVSAGLGVSSPAGTSTFIKPTNYIVKNGPVLIDGLTVDFQLTPGTEAPAEMNNYFADYRALWVAENCTGTLHNLYPIRGAQLRDSSAWAGFILEAMTKFADKSDVVFQSHNWPHFNTKENPDAVRDYLLNNASIYKYLHDQTLLYANEGFTAKEIAKKLRIPEHLKKNFYARPYYGSVQINARAVYTKYLGFFNGNPNDIDPLTEVEEADAFVSYAGPAEKILEKAYEDFKEGNYNRAAYAAGKVVLSDPDNKQARYLTADAFEQLGYSSESSVWRNAYLQGALELRFGTVDQGKTGTGGLKKNDLAQCMSPELLLGYIGILYDSHKADNEELKLRLIIDEDTYDGKSEKTFVLQIHAGVVLTYPIEKTASENTIRDFVKLPKDALFAIINKNLASVRDQIEGNGLKLLEEVEKNITTIAEYRKFQLIVSNERKGNV
ncbi:MAG: alkyl sulfatase dimerization domain-containing protein [Lachnospiraceae bacterium]|jgi:alkyl sulfatase BDS1-like metallo-beta-lactamase superfamily hydrolase|nr:alkyl sulfatase dimerization domain-containing protein [Lachnospiraceae bacterium]MEE3460321.1 alkyl sulfatase dimerization domain-containing protein [Lachnospiraceae bacterium]